MKRRLSWIVYWAMFGLSIFVLWQVHSNAATWDPNSPTISQNYQTVITKIQGNFATLNPNDFLGIDPNIAEILEGEDNFTDAELRTALDDLRLYNRLSVKWFGATGDGVTDDLAAIQSAITAAFALQDVVQTDPSVYTATRPTVFFPEGVYQLSGSISADAAQAINNLNLLGDRAILIAPDASTDILPGLGAYVDIDGLTFRKGKRGIVVKSNNAGTTITIRNCQFVDQNEFSVGSDATSQSTKGLIDSCLFWQSPGGAGGESVHLESGDLWELTNSVLYCYAQTAIYLSGARLLVRDCLGTPGGDILTNGGSWFQMEGDSILEVTDTALGGEGGGAYSIVRCDTQCSSLAITGALRVRNVNAYANKYFVEFRGLPNVIDLGECDGFTHANFKGLYLDPNLTLEDRQNFQWYGQARVAPSWYRDVLRFADCNETSQADTAKVLLAAMARSGSIPMPRPDVLYLDQIMGSSTMTGVSTTAVPGSGYPSIAAGTAADAHGVTRLTYTAPADLSAGTSNDLNYLDPTALDPNGLYTLVWDVQADSNAGVDLQMELGGVTVPSRRIYGREKVVIPFVYHNATGSQSNAYDRFQFAAYLAEDGDVFYGGRVLLLNGLVDWQGDVLKVVDANIPTSIGDGITQTSQYFRGDRWYSAAPDPNSYGAAIVTTAGAPGTWKGYGLLEP